MHSAVSQGRQVSISTALPPRLSPQDGDVVVTRETQERAHYTLRQFPANGQLRTPERKDAEALARAFGQTYAINVWYQEAGSYRLLAAYRPR